MKETGLSKGQVVKRLDDYNKRNPVFNVGKPNAITDNTIFTSGITAEKLGIDKFEDTLSEEDDFFKLPDGRDESLYLYKNADKQREKIQSYIENKYKGRAVKVLYMADLHIPFTNYSLVKHIIKEHSDADILVLNGDILDLFNVSTFAKDKTVALKRELQEGRDFLEVVSNIFEEVIVTEGNHERRLRRYIQHVIPVDMHFLFPQDVLEVIQQGHVFDKEPLENVHIVGSWWIKLFDAIIGHPDNYSSVPLRTVIQTSEHFKMVKNIPHRACIIGHTHQAGWLIDRGVLVMETGCLQHDVDYKHGSKFIKTTWTRAHAVLNFDENGEIVFENSKVIPFSV
jgi:predicted phosphodiesterase